LPVEKFCAEFGFVHRIFWNAAMSCRTTQLSNRVSFAVWTLLRGSVGA